MNTKQNTFISNLRELTEREYGVSVKYFNEDENKPEKRIDYKVAIKLEAHEQGWLMSLDKKDIFFNRHEPDAISERFATIISQSLYPIETIIDGWGKQVAGIVNHTAVLNRWELNKAKITEKYEGEVVNDFLKAVDNKIGNSTAIQRSMSYDLFWNLFFHPKYMAYGVTYKVPLDIYLSVIPYKHPLRFHGIQKIIPEVTDYGAIAVKFSSEELPAPEALLAENKKSGDCLMKLDIDFDLDKEHHFAMHTRAVLQVYRRLGKYTTVPVKKLQFTMYQV